MTICIWYVDIATHRIRVHTLTQQPMEYVPTHGALIDDKAVGGLSVVSEGAVAQAAGGLSWTVDRKRK